MNKERRSDSHPPFLAYHTLEAPSGGPSGPAPYSQIVRVGNLLFVTAQSPIDPKTKALIGDSVSEQMAAALANLKAVLAAAGSTIRDVFKTTVYMRSLSDIAQMNASYAEVFLEPYPARTILPMAELPFGALVYIEAIAVAHES
jgi:2-iminobutanoate/2-iminopropanoate deaminase